MCALNVRYNTCLTDVHYVARVVFVAFPCIAVPEGWTGDRGAMHYSQYIAVPEGWTGGHRGPLPLNKRSR